MLTTRRRDVVTEAATEVASLKKALSETKHKAALELKERKKQEARVGEVQAELQDSARSSSLRSGSLKQRRPSLRRPLQIQKMPRLKPRGLSKRSRRPRK